MLRDLPPQASPLVKRYEGFQKVAQRTPVVMAMPYRCPAGYWTIGYGSRCTADHPPITEEQGEELLAGQLEVALAAALRYCPALNSATDNQVAAIVSWTFNLGSARLKASRMRLRINERAWKAAALECRRWVYGGGRKLPGLVLRRAEEARYLTSS